MSLGVQAMCPDQLLTPLAEKESIAWVRAPRLLRKTPSILAAHITLSSTSWIFTFSDSERRHAVRTVRRREFPWIVSFSKMGYDIKGVSIYFWVWFAFKYTCSAPIIFGGRDEVTLLDGCLSRSGTIHAPHQSSTTSSECLERLQALMVK